MTWQSLNLLNRCGGTGGYPRGELPPLAPRPLIGRGWAKGDSSANGVGARRRQGWKAYAYCITMSIVTWSSLNLLNRCGGTGGYLRGETPSARASPPRLAEEGRRGIPRPMGLGLGKRRDESHMPIVLYVMHPRRLRACAEPRRSAARRGEASLV